MPPNDDESSFDATPITTSTVSIPTAKMSRRSPLAYYTSAAKRSFRDAFGRQQLLDAFKAFMWVAPLTILIWIYAEREQLVTQKNFPIPIEIRSADPRQVIAIVGPRDRNITADLVGPRAQLDRVRDEFRGGDARARIEIGSAELGPRQVPAELAGEDGRFAGNGVMLNNLQPRMLDVYVDVLDDVEVEVRLPSEVTNIGSASFRPATVKITAPRSAIQKQSSLVAYADPASFRQLKKPGTTEVKGVRVTLPLKDENVTLLTSTVDATVDVKQADVTTTLPSIPVWVTFAPGVEQKYKVTYEPTLSNVTVIGAADQIEAIKAGTAMPRPKATFEVSQEKFVVGTATQKAKVKYDLPEGVRIQPEDANRTIDFELVEKGPE